MRCRVCFEKTQRRSRLISPCSCKGSSLFIPVHCLEIWQELALQSNNLHKAMVCPVCKANFNYPQPVLMLYRCVLFALSYYANVIVAILRLTWVSCIVLPLKMILHALLIVVTLPWGQLSLGEVAVAWVGSEFPPQLALTYNDSRIGKPCIHPGTILIANYSIPSSSLFFKTVVLILDYTPRVGARGVILNLHLPYSQQRHVLLAEGSCCGLGGPMDPDIFTVLHNQIRLGQFSRCLLPAAPLFVAESALAQLTLQAMARLSRGEVERGTSSQGVLLPESDARRGGRVRSFLRKLSAKGLGLRSLRSGALLSMPGPTVAQLAYGTCSICAYSFGGQHGGGARGRGQGTAGARSRHRRPAAATTRRARRGGSERRKKVSIPTESQVRSGVLAGVRADRHRLGRCDSNCQRQRQRQCDRGERLGAYRARKQSVAGRATGGGAAHQYLARPASRATRPALSERRRALAVSSPGAVVAAADRGCHRALKTG
jgi:hypothetical protein